MNSRTLKSLLSNLIPTRLNNKGIKVILDVDDTHYYIRRAAEELSKVDPNLPKTTVELENTIFLLGVALYRMVETDENTNNPKLPKRSRGTNRPSDNQVHEATRVDVPTNSREPVSEWSAGPVGGPPELRS